MTPTRDQLLAGLSESVGDAKVLAAIASVPREAFVPRALRRRAYENVALPIGAEQTISQPLVVARMLELLALDGDEYVLDVGTGSGYHAMLLAHMAKRVVSIERHAELSRRAGRALATLGVENIELVVGDGSRGLPERGPYDAINVAAAADPAVVDELSAQLRLGGRLVAPVAEDEARPEAQRLMVIRARSGGVSTHRCEPVRFVPLVSDTSTEEPTGS